MSNKYLDKLRKKVFKGVRNPFAKQLLQGDARFSAQVIEGESTKATRQKLKRELSKELEDAEKDFNTYRKTPDNN